VRLKLLFGCNYFLLLIVGLIFFLVVIWFLSFKAIERIFGLLGLLMVVFIVVAWKMHPDTAQAAPGLVPTRHSGPPDTQLLYGYYAVGLLSWVMLPYETYFYASGAIE